MGTRNLTCVVKDGKYRVAKYCQWDGYPNGQGITILAFLQGLTKTRMATFKAKIEKCRFITDADADALVASIDSTGADPEKSLPSLYRDMGGTILEFIMKSEEESIPLLDRLSFAGESLFCEWAYVIDLDKGVFEVHKGFNKEPLQVGERFRDIPVVHKEYLQVRKLKEWKLSKLPTKAKFLAALTPEEE